MDRFLGYGSAGPRRTSRIRLTPESGSADNLSSITGGHDGDVLVLMVATASNTVTVKDSVGNLHPSADCALTGRATLTLIKDGTEWVEIARSINGA